jgi:S-DNA-T family DNA segregation ATPase FtsK/SpoIIIE
MQLNDVRTSNTSERLLAKLAVFKIRGTIAEVNVGPVVTTYDFVPEPGTRSAKIIDLADDIAREMSVTSLRIKTIAGTNRIGIEVPNTVREIVNFGAMLRTDTWLDSTALLPLALGKDVTGETVVVDLVKMPHVLIAGTTGSGKSVGIHGLIMSLLCKLSPRDCKFIMIDPKQTELVSYKLCPHLLSPVITDPSKAIAALQWVLLEMERRYSEMAKRSVRNIEGYNALMRATLAAGEIITEETFIGFSNGQPVYADEEVIADTMPYIVVVIDEVADLMLTAGKEVEKIILRLAGMARAAGIHLVMATQRPSSEIITGTIKANFPARISFRVGSKIDSRVVLGENGAETLLGNGDMLMSVGGKITRVHGAFVSTDEVEVAVEALYEAYGPAVQIEAVTAGV